MTLATNNPLLVSLIFISTVLVAEPRRTTADDITVTLTASLRSSDSHIPKLLDAMSKHPAIRLHYVDPTNNKDAARDGSRSEAQDVNLAQLSRRQTFRQHDLVIGFSGEKALLPGIEVRQRRPITSKYYIISKNRYSASVFISPNASGPKLYVPDSRFLDYVTFSNSILNSCIFSTLHGANFDWPIETIPDSFIIKENEYVLLKTFASHLTHLYQENVSPLHTHDLYEPAHYWKGAPVDSGSATTTSEVATCLEGHFASAVDDDPEHDLIRNLFSSLKDEERNVGVKQLQKMRDALVIAYDENNEDDYLLFLRQMGEFMESQKDDIQRRFRPKDFKKAKEEIEGYQDYSSAYYLLSSGVNAPIQKLVGEFFLYAVWDLKQIRLSQIQKSVAEKRGILGTDLAVLRRAQRRLETFLEEYQKLTPFRITIELLRAHYFLARINYLLSEQAYVVWTDSNVPLDIRSEQKQIRSDRWSDALSNAKLHCQYIAQLEDGANSGDEGYRILVHQHPMFELLEDILTTKIYQRLYREEGGSKCLLAEN